MLKRIYADNYRCLVNFTFEPRRMNLLVGDNGSGKSSLFEILDGIRNLVIWRYAAAEAFPASTLTRWHTEKVQQFELEVEGNGGIYKYALAIEHDCERGVASIKKEELTFNERSLYSHGPELVAPHGAQKRSALIFEAPRGKREIESITWFKDFLVLIRCFKLAPGVMVGRSEKEADRLAYDGSNFGSWYRYVALEERRRWLRQSTVT